jgi:hypothetical protein
MISFIKLGFKAKGSILNYGLLNSMGESSLGLVSFGLGGAVPHSFCRQ